MRNLREIKISNMYNGGYIRVLTKGHALMGGWLLLS